MKKLNKTQITKYVTFLEDNKEIVGLQAWTMVLNDEIGGDDDFAEVTSNIFEQILTVKLNQSFLDLENHRQTSVLIHELIHGRIDIYKKTLEEITNFEEERLVNDLERGIYGLYKKVYISEDS